MPSTVPPRPEPARRRRLGALFVMVAIAMDVLDTTIVVVALPAIEADLGVGGSALQWIAASYTLTFALTLVLAGRIGDLLGSKRMILVGMAGFVVASAVCAFAPTLPMLLAGRVLQAMAGAFILTQGLSIFQSTFPPDERASVFGMFGAVVGTSAVLGPLVGGLLLEADLWGLSWRPIFLINLPIGVITLVGTALLVTAPPPRGEGGLDLVGVALATTGLLALVYPLIQGESAGWPLWTYASMVAGALLLVVFLRQQRARVRAGRTPLVLPRLWRERSFVAGLGVILVFLAAFSSMFFVLAYYLQVGLGFSPLETGLTTLPSALSTVASSILSARLVARFGPRVLTAGSLAGVAGLVLLIVTISAAGTGATGWMLAPALLITGSGIGLVAAPVIDIILARVPVTDAGAASGVLNTAEQLGAAAGVAIVGSVFFALAAGDGSGEEIVGSALEGAILGALWVNVGLMAASAALTFLLPSGTAPRESVAVPSPTGS
ncbi:MAG: Uncharacterized MFS-type transporter [uncultured Pseudonocardia sp.]|uniref:Uncharacterized MFS-type transporter n=1 Tax=uncultured Pseudonocardia sp. TaxID=211455 RepID=A0A6J4QI79_9PSEU|nr:MAG: Uncharacterized MFS-type transporter [uncultured Pseudonocardia sp.]